VAKVHGGNENVTHVVWIRVNARAKSDTIGAINSGFIKPAVNFNSMNSTQSLKGHRM